MIHQNPGRRGTVAPMPRRSHLGSVPLPSFRRPPVVEVVIGAQLVGTDQYSLSSLGRFASELASQGLLVEDAQPALQIWPDTFGPHAPGMEASMEVLLGSGAPPIRQVLRNMAGNEMVQLQRDWIAVNWRKTSPGNAYPRWPSRWETFQNRAALAERYFGAGQLRYGVVEVTYVNQIELPHKEASRVFSFLNPSDSLTDEFLPPAEQLQANLSYPIQPNSNSEPVGRLTVDMKPGWSAADKRQVLVMTLVARGNPDTPTLDGVRDFAGLAREWIVRGFTDSTSPEMHEIWEREDTKGSD